MATVISVKAALATAIETLISGATRATRSDLRPLDGIAAAGGYLYQIEAQHQGELQTGNSATSYKVGAFVVRVKHRLADPFDEAAYTDAAMLTHQSSLLDPDWWRSLAGVKHIVSGPEIAEDVARNGDNVTYSVACNCAITP